MSNNQKPVILTGLRANNDLHLGNYFGGLLPLVELASKKAGDYQINLFVPDLHSFTTPIDHSQLQSQIKHNLRLFVAAGLPLDHADVYIYRQSRIPAHSELTVILNSFVGCGELSRMTQFKDKSAKLGGDRVSVGLFDYPVLMAADILLYGAKYIPLGQDQDQHVELTRDLAARFNKQFGDTFVVPEPVAKQNSFAGRDAGLRIKDLQDPTKKMSKSDQSDKGIIFLGDSPEAAAKKFMSATTDSLGVVNYDPDSQPGVSNLLQILACLRSKPLKEVVAQYQGQTTYGPLKTDLAQATSQFLSEFQNRLAKVDQAQLDQKLAGSEAAMNKQAQQRLEAVQKAVGLRA
jgi:tryptophanyl-tRNA synthetase